MSSLEPGAAGVSLSVKTWRCLNDPGKDPTPGGAGFWGLQPGPRRWHGLRGV